MFRLVSCLIGFVTLTLSNAQTQGGVPEGPRSLKGTKVTIAPKIDGVLGSGEWESLTYGEGFYDLDTGLVSDEKAEFWIGYDDKFVYFAARAFTDPNRLVAEEYRQNVNLSGNDAFSLALDCPANGQSLELFTINPQGATNLRLAGGRAAKTEWLGDFEAVGKRTETGWQVEAAVPWKLVKRSASGVHDLVFNVLWYRSNKNNTYEWEYTKNNFANFPKLTGVDVPAIGIERTLKLLPYGYIGYDKETKHIANAGLDLKTEVSDNITVVGTVNPDFRNIENSILSLDFSYFERLASDNRPFFQEGSSYRRFGFDAQLFSSQRVGDFDAGLNVYGELGQTTFGVVSMADVGIRHITALSTLTRFDSHSSLTANYVGNAEKGLRNNAGRLFYSKQVGDWEYYAGAEGTDDQVEKTGTRLTTGMFRQNGGVYANIDYTEASPGYFPRVGFAPEKDFRALFLQYGREIQPYGKVIRDYSYEVTSLLSNRMNGDPYRRRFAANGQLAFSNKLRLSAQAQVENFEGSHDHFWQLAMGFPTGSPYRNVDVNYSQGRFAGEMYKSYGFGARYRPIPRSQVDLRTQWVEYIDFSRQIILSTSYDIGRYEAIGGRLVQSDNKWNWYLSYRITGKRGNEFYLILGDPNSNEFRQSLILKAVIPLSIRY